MCSSSHVSSLKYPPRNTASLFSAPPSLSTTNETLYFPSHVVASRDATKRSPLSLSLSFFRSFFSPHFLQQHHSLFLLSQYYTHTHSLSLFPTPYSCYFHVCICIYTRALSRAASLSLFPPLSLSPSRSPSDAVCPKVLLDFVPFFVAGF